MALINNTLNINLVDEHKEFVLNLQTREFDIPRDYVIAVEGDNNSQEITFKVPRYYDGIDLSTLQCLVGFWTTWEDDSEEPTHSEDSINITETLKIKSEWIYYTWILNLEQTGKSGICYFAIKFCDEKRSNSGYVLGYDYILTSKQGSFEIVPSNLGISGKFILPSKFDQGYKEGHDEGYEDGVASGSMMDAIVDQDFDASSRYAQSGRAIASELNNYIPQDFKIIMNTNFANALKGTKSGAAVVANDVSPIEHNAYVALRNKNLWNKTYGANKSNWEILDDYYYVLPIKVGKGNIVTVSYKNELAGNGLGFFTAVMTERSSVTSVTTWLYHNTNSSAYTKRVVTLTATEENIYIRTSIPSKGGLGSNTFALFVEYINDTLQIELGTTETNYTPYLTDFSSVSVIKSGLNLWWGNTTDNPQFEGNGYINTNGSISTHTTRVFRIPIKDTLKYNVTRNDGAAKLGIIVRYEDKNKNFISVDTVNYNQPYALYTPPKNASYLLFSASETSGNLYCFSIAESANNNWEEPKIGQTVAASADGTVKGLTAIYPTTTITTDTTGIVVDMEYNRDINKAFAELQQAIISLGGNL